MDFYIMDLKLHRLSEHAIPVSYGTQDSACFDISACLKDRATVKGYYGNNESVIYVFHQDENDVWVKIPPKGRVLIPTGLIMDIPKDHCVKVYPRSGLSIKKGLGFTNSVGIIDSDYIEEVFIPVINLSEQELTIKHGDRIAQAELVFAKQASFTYISDRPQKKTDRSGGFGSTGMNTTT